MNTVEPQAIYRKDYQPSAYLIRTTELSFDLSEDETLVSSKVHYYQNPNLASQERRLFLNGVNLELISISIDGVQPNYQLVDEGLEISDLADEFTLEITTRIHPEKNTSLNGLYQSSGNFCTQCEAHGFRQITYYLDRPDVLSVFTTHIKADHKRYPILLSNGNLISSKPGEVTWHDPSLKPCYLFALVAGDFAVLEDTYTTISGKEVALKIYVESHNIDKTQFAMDSLKRSFAWDEQRFGLEYDLDIYMIVAVDDFNMGAMENKGLNIFNSTYVLANPDTATDKDFINVEAVIGHEYFHNWTGNRVTCQDWFQLSLKEGLTVFRDQEFTSDLHSRSIKRIEDVNGLRTFQFAEDAGPMKHPVRPESYIEMNNFYTYTVYEKGAEVIRMIHTLLGETGFQSGMKLYFERHDGQAVTIDDFVAAMSDANDFDFKPFMAWYSQPGTPEVEVNTEYDAQQKTYKATFKQEGKHTYYLPIRYGLMNQRGEEIEQGILVLDQNQKTFEFKDIQNEPTPSWLRGFSAPIKLTSNLNTEQKIFLCEHDTDAFSRWDNAQALWSSLILNPEQIDEGALFSAFENILTKETDNALISELLTLPSERLIHLQMDEINIIEAKQKREAVIDKIVQRFKPVLLSIYNRLNTADVFELTPGAVGNRSLKNTCLSYLVKAGEFDLAYHQFESANCMSDRLAAFNALLSVDNSHQD
ncbi:MAG TPA: aminopeptidase N, partial [Gammaproteobacteria bacterium]|nr:aminopeptidase N [Gammaproteobacteria bacterium]HBA25083.1 aminopeptidase N [Gammaproteobacteria bacterium]HCA67853.1 aminopeptidase N [Gammaproteobacteria bacterium]HCH58259.1 aminopeptidase N [Gammaproteobacteria bacterium]